jgi:hypothetical protein
LVFTGRIGLQNGLVFHREDRIFYSFTPQSCVNKDEIQIFQMTNLLPFVITLFSPKGKLLYLRKYPAGAGKSPTPFMVRSQAIPPVFIRKNPDLRGMAVIPAAIKKKSYFAALFYYQYN